LINEVWRILHKVRMTDPSITLLSNRTGQGLKQ
jgi:hypothetical protein